ncbi:MAG: DUF3108 domain-containing protein [Alphaproteobacteria bacterium]|nr:DUF3108 domain-containing protein [Alphaproteobacteria bacterium]
MKFLALFLLCCGLAGQATADTIPNVKNLRLSYSVYLGGLHAMDGLVSFTRSGGTYKIDLHTGTQGLLRSIAPWDAQVISNGRIRQTELHPTNSKVLTYWKEKPNSVNFAFSGNSVKATFTPPEGESKNEPVPTEMKRGVLDPLSGVLQIIANTTYNSECKQTVPIYDGHRRFDLTLNNSGTEELDGEDYSVFTGTAQRCIVDFKMLAGSRKDREGSQFWQDGTDNNNNLGRWGKSDRPPVYIFLGKVRDDLPELPVRAETSTVFGAIMVHLNKVEGGKGPTLTVP